MSINEILSKDIDKLVVTITAKCVDAKIDEDDEVTDELISTCMDYAESHALDIVVAWVHEAHATKHYGLDEVFNTLSTPEKELLCKHLKKVRDEINEID